MKLTVNVARNTCNINKSLVLLLDAILTIFNNTHFNILINNYAYLNSSFNY